MYRQSENLFGVEAPRDSEEFRFGFETMAMLLCYLRLRTPNLAALGAVTMEAWNKFF